MLRTLPISFVVVLFSLLPNVGESASLHPSCADDAECDRLANEARENSKTGHFDEAQRSYEQAFARRADPMLLFNLARVLHKAGRPAIAVIYYQKFLDSRPDVTVSERKKSEQYLRQAQDDAATAATKSSSAPSSPPTATSSSPSLPPAASPPISQSSSADSSREGVPLYRKWWLWTIVGGAVGITVIGLAAGLAPRRPDVTGLPEARPFGN